MKIKLPKKIIFLLAVALSLGLIKTASAQAVRTMTIVPPSIEANLNPGEKTEGTMKVINDSDETLYFTADVKDFVVNDTVGTPELLPDNTLNNKYSAASWIGVYPTSFSVAPHDKEVLNYYVQLPADARPGGHYAAVVYTPDSSGKVGGSGASVNTQIGSLFYISVNGNINEKADVIEFLAKKFLEYGPANIMTQILNSGDLHIRPQGTITLYDAFGRKVDQRQLEEHNIFPGASRSFTSTIGKGLMIGPYKAVFLGTYGKNNNLPLNATLSFFVFPWKIALLIILIIVAVILGTRYMNKRGGKTSPKTTEPAQPTTNQPEASQGPTVIKN